MVKELGGSGYHSWSSRSGGGGGSSDGVFDDFESPYFPVLEEANKKIRETPKEDNDQDEMAKKLLNLCPLGLQLSLTSNWMSDLNYNSTDEGRATHHSNDHQFQATTSELSQQPMSEKLKASNFAAKYIKIGSWERNSKNEGDLVAKCYFAKKKLVWELLKGGLKSKIEIQWNDIIAISAVMKENEPGVLQIELNQPPTFHEETDPQPRKHTIWKPAADFTGGQASIFRRHFLRFPPGYLDKHYEKLLHSEPRLFELSKKPFPSMKSPYFYAKFPGFRGICFECDINPNPGLLFNFPSFPPTFAHSQHVQPSGQTGLSALKETLSPSSDSCNVLENQRMAYWVQGMADYADSLARNQVESGLAPSVPTTHLNSVPTTHLNSELNPAVSFQSYDLTSYSQEGAEMNNYSSGTPVDDIDYELNNDMNVPNYDEEYRLARVASLSQLINLHEEGNPETKNASQETFYGPDSSAEENLIFSSNLNADVVSVGGQFYQPHLVPGLPPQIIPVNSLVNQHWNNLAHGPVINPDPTMDEFGNVNNFSNNWC